MSTYNDQITIAEGMEVVASDGGKIGKIDEVQSDHFIAKDGFLFPKSAYIPMTAVANADEKTIYLNVTEQEALSQDPSWEQPPTGAGMNDDPEPFDHEQDSSRTYVNEDDHLRVDVAEEELTATKRQVDRGDVGIHKSVVAEDREIDVPVTEERVNVSRRTVDRDAAPGEDTFQEGTIEVPVHGEEVDVQKRTRVTGEVDVDKEAVQGNKHVSDTVRHEEVTVDGDVVEGAGDNGSKSKRDDKKKRR